MGNGFSFPNSLPSMNNVKKFGSGIIGKLPSPNNIRRFGSGIIDKLPSVASKTGEVLTSTTSQNIVKNVGTSILTNEFRSRIRGHKTRIRTFGGSKKKKTSDKKKHSKKEKKSSKK